MAITRERLADCDGFRIRSPEGLVGWVEETWLGPAGEPSALAVRALDGRRGLLFADDVDAADPETETVFLGPGVALLELDAPRIQTVPADGSQRSPVLASWRTTGAVLAPPRPPGVLRQAILARRPWRLAPPPADRVEPPLWLVVALLYAGLTLFAAFVIALTFLVAPLLAAGVS